MYLPFTKPRKRHTMCIFVANADTMKDKPYTVAPINVTVLNPYFFPMKFPIGAAE